MIEAHYTSLTKADRTRHEGCKGVLSIAHRIGSDREWTNQRIYVNSKAHARTVAASINAQPWNF